jgi:hypothetical protein
VKAKEARLWEGRVRRLRAELRRERSRTRRPAQRQALADLIGCLGRQDARLAYDRFRERGLEIGSGVVESAAQHVIGVRMKRPGMRWSAPGAQAMLSLRVASLNHDRQELWATRPLRPAA